MSPHSHFHDDRSDAKEEISEKGIHLFKICKNASYIDTTLRGVKVGAAVLVQLPLDVIQGSATITGARKERQLLLIDIFTFQMTRRQKLDLTHCTLIGNDRVCCL